MLQTLNVYALCTRLCIEIHCSKLKGISKSIKNVFEAIPQTLRWRESCVVAACRVSAVIWLKCVRNVIWAHLIYFIHWQPIWPGLSAILQFQLAHNLGAAAEPQPLIGQVSPCLASDWLVRPLTGHNIGAQFTRVERQQCAALYDQATSQATSTRGKYQRFPPITFQVMGLSWRGLSSNMDVKC